MFKLLPEKYIASLRRGYRIRLATVAAFFLCLAVLIGIVALFPSYILSQGQESQALSTLAAFKKVSGGQNASQAETDVTTTKSLIDSLVTHQDTIAISTIIESIVLHRASGITLNSISVSRTTPTTQTVAMNGVAVSRDVLVVFQKSLEQDPHFTKVELPIGSLAKVKDIHFGITAQTNW